MALNEWTDKLLKRPMDVFRSKPVSPPDQGEMVATYEMGPNNVRYANYDPGFAKPTALNTDGMMSRFFRPGTTTGYDEYRHAQVNRPIGHIKLKPATDPGLLGALTFDVKVAESDDRIPCYFLPWSSKVLVEMQIPEKKTANDDPDDPNIFFTAAINGCSVFVSGDPRSPSVSHAGISQGSTPYGDDAAKFWRDLAISSKASSPTPPGKIYEINNTDYINQTGRSGGAQTANADAYKRFLDRMPPGPFTIEEVIPWGCVFGIRYGRLWSFYLQENVRIKRYRMYRKTQAATFQKLVPKKNVFGKQKGYKVEEYEGTESVEVREDHNINRTMLVRPFFPGPMPKIEYRPTFRRV